jgi:hypothetical protein
MIKGRPPRLEQIFQTYAPPLFFITICAIHRKKIGDLQAAHQAFELTSAELVMNLAWPSEDI